MHEPSPIEPATKQGPSDWCADTAMFLFGVWAMAYELDTKEEAEARWETLTQEQRQAWYAVAAAVTTLDVAPACRISGCTDDVACEAPPVGPSPCMWVEEDLCSACVEIAAKEAARGG